jgi:hypothetical protein
VCRVGRGVDDAGPVAVARGGCVPVPGDWTSWLIAYAEHKLVPGFHRRRGGGVARKVDARELWLAELHQRGDGLYAHVAVLREPVPLGLQEARRDKGVYRQGARFCIAASQFFPSNGLGAIAARLC